MDRLVVSAVDSLPVVDSPPVEVVVAADTRPVVTHPADPPPPSARAVSTSL